MEENNHALTDDPFVSVDYVMKFFGLSRVTVESWLASGELPHYRLGPRTIRIARADLERFIADRRRTTLLTRDEVKELQSGSKTTDIPTGSEDIRNRCSAPGEEAPAREAAA